MWLAAAVNITMVPHNMLLIYCGISALLTYNCNVASAFISPSSSASSRRCIDTNAIKTFSNFPLYQQPTITTLKSQSNDNVIEETQTYTCWNPNLRKQLATISSLGILETAYLTYDKIQYTSTNGQTTSSFVNALCSDNGNGASSCNDVLHGPYASIHLGSSIDIPLSALGMAAYTIIFVLSILPLLLNSDDNNIQSNNNINGDNINGEVKVLDGDNRIALLGGTTLMASFSIYLVSLLLGVLHANCLFCFVSAGLSITMASLCWFSGMLPTADWIDGSLLFTDEVRFLRRRGFTLSASAVGVSTVAALGLFLSVSDGSFDSSSGASSYSASTSVGSSGTLLASTGSSSAQPPAFTDNKPPRITTKSSTAALALASDLKALDSRMFGAFWCSHCYDQKQAFGYEAMQTIPYVECDREGYNNKREMCKEKELPGYPTWEIGGELFPGEKSLDELREIVDDINKK